jgi:hypothetical protein
VYGRDQGPSGHVHLCLPLAPTRESSLPSKSVALEERPQPGPGPDPGQEPQGQSSEGEGLGGVPCPCCTSPETSANFVRTLVRNGAPT